jgi:hypothetical protein
MAQIVIAYAGHNLDLVRVISDKIEALQGYTVFYDKHPTRGLLVGEDYETRINSEIDAARIVLGILDAETLEGHPYPVGECKRAFVAKKLFPIRVDGLAAGALPPEFNRLHSHDLTDEDGFGLDDVLAEVRRRLEPERHKTELARQDAAPIDWGVFIRQVRSLRRWSSAVCCALTSTRCKV